MPNQEFYEELRKETEGKIKAYKQFSENAEETKKSMKFLAKQIKSNNDLLKDKGQEVVVFKV